MNNMNDVLLYKGRRESVSKKRNRIKLKTIIRRWLVFIAVTFVVITSVREMLITNPKIISGQWFFRNQEADYVENLELSFYLDELANLKKAYPEVQAIINNIGRYPIELLELAVKNKESIGFVADYIDYLNFGHSSDIDVSGNYVQGEIPLFMQWDKRWGYFNYGNGMIALDGCGPTALSMVIVGLTQNTSINPRVIADYSSQNGYLAEGEATSWTLMSEGAKHFGVKGVELPLSKGVILDALEQGKPIIATMRPGDFTTTGHFIVLKGISKEGKILINDSNSYARSSEEWDIEVLMNQMKNLWSFTTM